MTVIKRIVSSSERHLRSATEILQGQKEDLSSIDSQSIFNAANQAMEAARELYRLAGILEAKTHL